MPGCDKSETPAQSGSQDEAKSKSEEPSKAEAIEDDQGPFASFDLPQVAKKWQGAWVVQGGSSAWQVDGNEVTVFDGNRDEAREFVVQAPCQVAVIERSEGGSSSTIHKFAFDGDTLYAGLGNAGVKKGDVVAACISNEVFTLEGGKCLAWKESRFGKGKWESEDAACSLSREDDTETFEAKGTKLELVGEALVDRQMKGNQAQRLGSFDEAKAAMK